MQEKLFDRFHYQVVIKVLWALLVITTMGIMLTFIIVARTKMPDTADLENPKFEQSTIVYSSDGEEIDRYFRKNRQWVSFDELSPFVIDALIATEDHRFFSHSGIDPKGTARAVLLLGSRGGASTITQQLAKQFFTPVRSNNFAKRVWQKVKEWVIAIEFERRYTKEEILAMLLNKFEFIYGANGIGAAAQVYFGKDQSELNINEAAMLIGMLKSPYVYNPHTFPERAKGRRYTVLSQMRKRGYITADQHTELKNEELDMSKFRRTENYQGLAPYFMSELKKYVRQLLEENHITKPGGEKYDLDMDGLRIYTTINAAMQRHAEAASKQHLTNLQTTFDNSWKENDLWEYYEEGQRRDVRTNILNKQIENSNRYQKLRQKYLGDISNKITSQVEHSRLWNADVIRMLKAESNANYLEELIAIDHISQDQQKAYETILSSPMWLHLRKAWKDFQLAVRTEFNTPVPIKIYSHQGIRPVTMSPIDSIKYMLDFLQIGTVSIDPRTGHVKTWVGGADYDIWKYDHVTSNRQVGSTFKPFLYTTAIMNAFSPCYRVQDRQYTIPANDPNFGLSQSWSPQNFRSTFSNEEVTLKEALRKSLNSVSLWLVMQLGSFDQMIELANNMGIDKDKIPKYPSIILGTPNLSVLEMTAAYSTFANNGVSVKPVFVDRIANKNGVTIYQSEVVHNRSIPENYNHVMVEMLKYASSSINYALKSDFGGKTGTTNNHVDGWFMGITPELVVGTWVGGEYPWIRFTNSSMGQGGFMARPYFINFMQRLEKEKLVNTNARFLFPGDLDIELDCSRYDSLRTEEPPIKEFDDVFN